MMINIDAMGYLFTGAVAVCLPAGGRCVRLSLDSRELLDGE